METQIFEKHQAILWKETKIYDLYVTCIYEGHNASTVWEDTTVKLKKKALLSSIFTKIRNLTDKERYLLLLTLKMTVVSWLKDCYFFNKKWQVITMNWWMEKFSKNGLKKCCQDWNQDAELLQTMHHTTALGYQVDTTHHGTSKTLMTCFSMKVSLNWTLKIIKNSWGY